MDDVSILDGLCAAPGEVAHIFDHLLEAVLNRELARSERLMPIGSEDWPYEAELYVSRRHFRTHTRAAESRRFLCWVVDRTSWIAHGQARRTACIVFGALPLRSRDSWRTF
jgi:hypothetical protein